MTPLISIIIPQYKTYEVTRICLRALKKFSTQNIEIIVVDNNSADESLEYLRKVPWIKLIENKQALIGGDGHKQALDIGIKAAQGQWILLFHSDTVVLKHGWDEDLMYLMHKYPDVVGASSVVREVNRFSSFGSRLVRSIKERKYNYHYCFDTTSEKVMSYCFLIKRDFLLVSKFNFLNASGDVADAFYHNEIKDKHPFIFLGRCFLINILWHTSNISSILTGQITDRTLIAKSHKKINRFLSSPSIKALIVDDELDEL